LLAALWALSAGSACAIDPHRALSQYVRDRWGTEQGFPRGPVYAIAQTSDGYLWIGTGAGLVRFDGVRFTVMHGRSTFSFGSVLGLAADRDGGLWLQLEDQTLLRYRNGDFEFPFPDRTRVRYISALTTGNNGRLLAAKSPGAFAYGGGELIQVAAAQDMPRTPVISIAQSGDGDIWLGTRGAGLFRLANGQTSAIAQGLPDLKVNCILPDGKTDLWIGTDSGLARWSGGRLAGGGIAGAAATSLDKSQILALLKDRDANLWVGTDSGRLMRVNSGGVTSLDRDPGERANAVTSLFEDREGNLWIGSADGIERLRDSPFLTYSQPEGLPTDGSNPIYVDAQGRMWFPPVSGGLWWFQDGRHGKVAEAGLDRDIVYSIAGRGSELWAGRQRGGLTRLRSANGTLTATTYTVADGLAQNSVYSLYAAPNGAVWAGTLSGGVSRLEDRKFTTYTVADGLASNTVASILQSRTGAMWFATPGGLSSFSGGRWQTYTTAQGLPSANVNCLLEDSDGGLWAGTAQGLAFLRSGRFLAVSKGPSALREQILGMAEDKTGAFWIATSNHVLTVRRAALSGGVFKAEDIREFGLADGLRGMEGVKRHRSVIADASGRVWMSLNRGISVVDPARITRATARALPQIQTVSADGSPLVLKGLVHIPAGSQHMTFGFTGLSLAMPERVRYRYLLEGYDHDWSQPVSLPEAAYTNLGPGPYRLRVRAANADGVWSAQEASLEFRVDPKWWQTWWFRGGLALAFGIAAVAAYRLRLMQLTARLNLRFEERLAERTRIAQELHDTLLQGFLSASMQIHVAASGLPDQSPVKTSLTRSLDLMRKVMEEGRNTVRGLRSTRSASMDLEEAFSQIQEELADFGEAVEFRVVAEGPRMRLHPLMRDEVYRIGREALLNAFRHARAKKIEIELTYSHRALQVVVRDDGCGIEPEVLESGRDGHWGLSGMRERAERIGARLRLWSRAMGGTEVELTVPGHVAFRERAKAKETAV
jgi:ligand-binding sensor domain-containing protein/signal transduction histidine kinase